MGRHQRCHTANGGLPKSPYLPTICICAFALWALALAKGSGLAALLLCAVHPPAQQALALVTSLGVLQQWCKKLLSSFITRRNQTGMNVQDQFFFWINENGANRNNRKVEHWKRPRASSRYSVCCEVKLLLLYNS